MKNYNYYLKWTLLFFCVSFQAVSQNTAAKEINRLEKLAAKVTIIRDNWGIAHVYGKTDADGYAPMRRCGLWQDGSRDARGLQMHHVRLSGIRSLSDDGPRGAAL